MSRRTGEQVWSMESSDDVKHKSMWVCDLGFGVVRVSISEPLAGCVKERHNWIISETLERVSLLSPFHTLSLGSPSQGVVEGCPLLEAPKAQSNLPNHCCHPRLYTALLLSSLY